MIEFVRCNPGDLLPKDLDSVVDTLDGVKCFSETLANGAVKHKVAVKLSTRLEVTFFDIEC